MSNPTRNDEVRSADAGRRASGDRPARTTSMLQESPNPEMFSTPSSRKKLSLDSLVEKKKVLAYSVLAVLVVLAVVAAAMTVLGGDGDAAPSQPAESSSATAPALDRSKEVPGAMIRYRPELPDGMQTPSQTIQSMVRNFYTLRSTAGVMPYFAPGSTFDRRFIEDNIKNVQVGTRVTDLYMFPANPDKLKRKPLGEDPQVWLATAMFTLPNGEVYVESMLFMTVRVDGEYKIQEMATLS